MSFRRRQVAELGVPAGRGRIALVVRDYFPVPGGTSTQTRLHAAEFVKAGYEVTILTRRVPETPASEDIDGVHVRRVANDAHTNHGKLRLIAASALWLACNRRRILGVSVIMDPDLSIAALATGLMSRTIITWATMGDATRSLTGVPAKMRRRLYAAAGQVALTTEIRDELEQLRLPEATIVPVPVDTANYHPVSDEDSQEVRTSLGLSTTTFVILFVGHVQPRKGVDRLLTAVEQLIKSGEDVTLLIVGGPVEREDVQYDSELRMRADTEAHGRIRFVGQRHDIPRFLAAADVFCLPSYREGMPNALLEAMASGIPCIAPASAGGEALLNGGLGFVPADNSPETLRAALVEVMENRSDAADRARRALHRVRAANDPSNVAASYLSLFGVDRPADGNAS